MRKVDLRLETVTPLFLGGADQEPELRAASIRGVLRFWLRSLIGGVVGDGNLNALRKAESDVFGETESGSPVVVRLSGQSSIQRFSTNQSGVQYLLWSMLRNNRQCLPAGVLFTLTLQTHPGVDSDEPLKGALASLWLLTHLGGIGSRSRRGGGGIQVMSGSDKLPFVMPDLGVRAQTPQRLHEELADGLKQLRALVGISGTTSSAPSASPTFDVLHPNCCRIVVLGKTWSTWEQAMDEVGQKFANFRHERPPEHPAIEQIVSAAAGLGTTTSLSGVERAAFGLPLPFHFRAVLQALERQGLDRREAQRKAQAVVQPERESHDRRASPLLIRILRLASGKYTVVMTVFQSVLLDGAEKLVLKQGRRVLATAATPNLSLIDAFLSEIRTSIGWLEVKKW